MNQLLSLDQTVITQQAGVACRVEKFLGGGAQGEVYQAELAGQPVALKWYFPHYLQQDPKLRQRIEQIVRSGAPSDRFLWPLDVVINPADTRSFGYLMPLREERFKGLVDLVTRRVDTTFRPLITTGFELAFNYRKLHAKGLCYRDIAFGNVFFDPATGEVRICDNDNVDINNTPGPVNGTPRFMAPEIVRGDAQPNEQTDLFSLAVLLFYLLCNHHPLEGQRETAIRCFDQAAMTKLYGRDALFIFDPADDSNRPVPGEHDNALIFWPLYPQFLRDLFTHAFTEGVRNPVAGRVRESEWCATLQRLRDAIFYCPQCGSQNFYDPDALRAGRQLSCWACQTILELPPRLRIQQGSERRIVMLTHDACLYPHHLDSSRAYTFDAPVATVTQHPTNPAQWGLQNLSPERWVATTSSGAVRDVPSGRTLALASGTLIHFGPSDGEIRL